MATKTHYAAVFTMRLFCASTSAARSDIRADAAAGLRRILAADPAAAPNYHPKAYWEAKLGALKAGVPLKDALRILLLDMTDEQRRKALEMQIWSGQSGVSTYRLDDYWIVTLQLGDIGREKLLAPPKLTRSARRVWVEPPRGYTGTWVTWRVNGQKACEIEYAEGRYDGTFTSFHDDVRFSHLCSRRECIGNGFQNILNSRRKPRVG